MYDEKFRRRVIAYKDSGHTFTEVYEAFGIRSQRYYIWKSELKKTGKFTNRYPKEHEGKIDGVKLAALLKEHPAPYMAIGI